MRKMLYCIVGETGAGKDTVTERLCKELHYKKVISFTDAPIRSDQRDGREHWFLTKDGFTTMMAQDTVIAYTKIGDNRYMATMEQLDDLTRFYIIDPKGVKDLKRRFGDQLYILVIRLTVPEEIRRKRTENRQNFDFTKRALSERKQFQEFADSDDWDIEVENLDLEQTVQTIAESIRSFEKNLKNNREAIDKQLYISRYKDVLNDYFSEDSINGGLMKRAKVDEIEYVMEYVLGIRKDDIRKMHDELYWKRFGKH